jgi:hypothetical protein
MIDSGGREMMIVCEWLFRWGVYYIYIHSGACETGQRGEWGRSRG